jgi:glycosyltransferase involved in cell wall biosynthesis
MKTVWILNHYAQEPGGPGGTRHYSLAKNMLRHGWQGAIIAASVELNTGRQRLAKSDCSKLCQHDGVDFLWIRTPTHQGNDNGRISNMLSYTLRALMPRTTCLLPSPDVIIGSSVHPFAAWAGAILAKRFRVPFVFEVRDLWPQTLVDMGRLKPGSFQTKALRALEKWLYRKADRVIVLLPRAVDYISALGIDVGKIEWIPNGVELDGYRRPTPAPIQKKFTLMYFGAHGIANGLDCLVKAMALVRKKAGGDRICLRLVGDGPQKKWLVNFANEQRLDNVQFEEPVPKHLIPALAQEADCFVFNLIDAPVFKYGISSNKLFDFMAAARPIIFCCRSSNNPVMEAAAGPTVPPGNEQALAEAILHLAQTPADELARMGMSARDYVERLHSYSSLSERFAKMLNNLIQNKK